MQELIDALSVSENVTVHPASKSDFLDWDGYLNKFYFSITGKIKKNHIFLAPAVILLLKEPNWLWNWGKAIRSAMKKLTTMQLRGVLKVEMNTSIWKM